MYGLFDPKWLYIICVTGFEVGSAVCGASPSMNGLIVGRAIAGLGGAGMYIGVVMLLSTFTTQAERPNYFAMLGGTFGVGTVFDFPLPKPRLSFLIMSWLLILIKASAPLLEVPLLTARPHGAGPFISTSASAASSPPSTSSISPRAIHGPGPLSSLAAARSTTSVLSSKWALSSRASWPSLSVAFFTAGTAQLSSLFSFSPLSSSSSSDFSRRSLS